MFTSDDCRSCEDLRISLGAAANFPTPWRPRGVEDDSEHPRSAARKRTNFTSTYPLSSAKQKGRTCSSLPKASQKQEVKTKGRLIEAKFNHRGAEPLPRICDSAIRFKITTPASAHVNVIIATEASSTVWNCGSKGAFPKIA